MHGLPSFTDIFHSYHAHRRTGGRWSFQRIAPGQHTVSGEISYLAIGGLRDEQLIIHGVNCFELVPGQPNRDVPCDVYTLQNNSVDLTVTSTGYTFHSRDECGHLTDEQSGVTTKLIRLEVPLTIPLSAAAQSGFNRDPSLPILMPA